MNEGAIETQQGKIICPREELDLGITLNGGQSFRWSAENNGYRGVFNGCVWTLVQNDTHLSYVVQELCKEWSAIDEHFQKSLDKTNGVRILKQEVVENVFSFICSSNNNIQRISTMVEKLCFLFGEKICSIEGRDYYNFPSIEALAKGSIEQKLKEEKFGYRSKYIAHTAKRLMELGGKEWLLGLHKDNNVSYNEAMEKLIILPGIGPKVADCICLMSLGHLEAVPVDTHIKQIAVTTYLVHLQQQKQISNQQVSNYLRNLWGPFAGWAQAVVFCAKINKPQSKIPPRKKSKRKSLCN
ncbi:8-oxoguanine DNA glycosylase isoform X2 [Nomia melanderi]|uniref:8-oxoguanine DNA glycosylase isoform X2 n=1 Tax=Nomia melanderi TaxID=2448451 RepID=UPI003FCC9D57